MIAKLSSQFVNFDIFSSAIPTQRRPDPLLKPSTHCDLDQAAS